MSLNIKLAETTTPDGGRLVLYAQGADFCIRLNGLQLMHSAAGSSELLLGEVAVEGLCALTAPRILIGGLGLGFTLKSVLQKVGRGATVQVAELVPEVVVWNQQFMSHLNGALLDDRRVEVLVADLWDLITHAGRARYDAVLLDVDNGPKAMVRNRTPGYTAGTAWSELLRRSSPADARSSGRPIRPRRSPHDWPEPGSV